LAGADPKKGKDGKVGIERKKEEEKDHLSIPCFLKENTSQHQDSCLYESAGWMKMAAT